MKKVLISCLAVLCFLFIHSVPACAIGQAEFFNNTTVDESMISYLMEQCGHSIECAKKTRISSYNEAESFKKDKKFEQAFVTRSFYQGMEMFRKDKDQIALDCIVAFDRPQ